MTTAIEAQAIEYQNMEKLTRQGSVSAASWLIRQVPDGVTGQTVQTLLEAMEWPLRPDRDYLRRRLSSDLIRCAINVVGWNSHCGWANEAERSS